LDNHDVTLNKGEIHIKQRKLHFISVALVVMSICFFISAALYYSLLDKYNDLRQDKILPSATTTETPTASPSPVPDKEAPEILMLQRQLAAAQTGELELELGHVSVLEDLARYPAPAPKKFVYLTFDDGPSQYTPKVLEILQENHIKATFFVEYSPGQDYYRQIVAGGHTLALHTYTHDYAQIYADETSFFHDLNLISDYVKAITGIETKIIRLAGGSSNTISRQYNAGVMSRIVADLDRQGYVYFDWNAQGMDATTPGISAADILKNVQSYTYVNGIAKPYIILLLHNGVDEPTTPYALQSVIDYYRSLGYTFQSITLDTPVIHQPVQN
jgi:peptidoglycan/xylan/chitin deacetylase (PgdA/CDA1 family)